MMSRVACRARCLAGSGGTYLYFISTGLNQCCCGYNGLEILLLLKTTDLLKLKWIWVWGYWFICDWAKAELRTAVNQLVAWAPYLHRVALTIPPTTAAEHSVVVINFNFHDLDSGFVRVWTCLRWCNQIPSPLSTSAHSLRRNDTELTFSSEPVITAT